MRDRKNSGDHMTQDGERDPKNAEKTIPIVVRDFIPPTDAASLSDVDSIVVSLTGLFLGSNN